jgi:hypothetical protein
MEPWEVLEEVHHFLNFGESPEQIATQLGRSIPAIYKIAWRVGDVRVARAFATERATIL